MPLRSAHAAQGTNPAWADTSRHAVAMRSSRTCSHHAAGWSVSPQPAACNHHASCKHHAPVPCLTRLPLLQNGQCAARRRTSARIRRTGDGLCCATNPDRLPQGAVGGVTQQQHDEFMALYHTLLPMSRRQLAAAAAQRPIILQASFLFWLQDLEKAANKPGGLFWTPRPPSGSDGLPPSPPSYINPGALLQFDSARSPPSSSDSTPEVSSPQQTAYSPQPNAYSPQPNAYSPQPNAYSQQPSTSQPSESVGFVLLSRKEEAGTGEDAAAPSNAGAAAIAAQPVSAATAAAPGQGECVRVHATEVAALASELVPLREMQEQDAARRLLPSLASSLAYDNLTRWRQETGAPAGTLTVPGVPQLPLEQLYRMSDEQERELAGGTGAWGQGGAGPAPAGGRRNRWGLGSSGTSSDRKKSSSGFLDGFAQRAGNEALAGVAAGAMARVRARFMGYEDGARAAAAVLDTLLWGAEDLGMRAEMVHTACNPPGLPYHPPPPTPHTADTGTAAADLSGTRPGTGTLSDSGRPSLRESAFLGGGGEGRGGGSRGDDDERAQGAHLGAYARSRPRAQPPPSRGIEGYGNGRDGQTQRPSEGDDSQISPGSLLCTTPKALEQEILSRQASIPADQQPKQSPAPAMQPMQPAPAQSPQAVLPCGASLAHALQDLLEVVQEYDRNVWSRRSDMERLGG